MDSTKTLVAVSVFIFQSHKAVIRFVKVFFDDTKTQESKHMKECVMFYNLMFC